MHNPWVALSWSLAVVPAYFILQALRDRLAPHGALAEAAGFAAAWYLCGRLLSEIVRFVLSSLGRPVDAPDPAAILRRTQRDMDAGRVPPVEGHLRLAACRVACGEFEAALTECGKADDRGATQTRAGQSRFLRARALEGLGNVEDAATLFRSIAGDSSLPRVHRVAARIRLHGLPAGAGAAAAEFVAELTALLDAPADPGRVDKAGDALPIDDEELEFTGNAVMDACRSAAALEGARAALDLLLSRARSGSTQRALRRMREGMQQLGAHARPGFRAPAGGKRD